MERKIFFILNGFILFVVFVNYYISLTGLWVEPSYREAIQGIAIFTVFLILLKIQIYFIFIKKTSPKNKLKFFITTITLLSIFLLAQMVPLKEIYRNDNFEYKDPLFEEYNKHIRIKGVTFDIDESNWNTDVAVSTDYWFDFQVQNDIQITPELVDQLNEYIPKNMQHPYVINFSQGDEANLSLFYSNKKQFAGCLSESNPKECERMYEVPLPSLLSKVQQNIAERNISFRYTGTDSNFEYMEPIYLFHIRESIESYNNPSGENGINKLFFEKLKGEITEADVISLLEIFREETIGERMHVYFSDGGKDPVTDASVSFYPIYEDYSTQADKLEYEICNKKFCQNIHTFRPYDPDKYTY